MYNFLRSIYRFARKLFLLPKEIHKKLFNYWFPNWRNLHSRKIVLASNVQFNQRTLFDGAGQVKIGKNCTFGYKYGGFHRGGSIEFQSRYKNAIIRIGENVATNNNIFICSANHIEIGNNTLIGQNVVLMDYEAHGINPAKRRGLGEIGQIIIHDNVWIGNNVSILKNSEIGENTIIATGAVVAGKFPDNVIIGGVPAKVIKNL